MYLYESDEGQLFEVEDALRMADGATDEELREHRVDCLECSAGYALGLVLTGDIDVSAADRMSVEHALLAIRAYVVWGAVSGWVAADEGALLGMYLRERGWLGVAAPSACEPDGMRLREERVAMAGLNAGVRDPGELEELLSLPHGLLADAAERLEDQGVVELMADGRMAYAGATRFAESLRRM